MAQMRLTVTRFCPARSAPQLQHRPREALAVVHPGTGFCSYCGISEGPAWKPRPIVKEPMSKRGATSNHHSALQSGYLQKGRGVVSAGVLVP